MESADEAVLNLLREDILNPNVIALGIQKTTAA